MNEIEPAEKISLYMLPSLPFQLLGRKHRIGSKFHKKLQITIIKKLSGFKYISNYRDHIAKLKKGSTLFNNS